MVKALIEAGADVNKADDDGRRRCTWPLRQGHEAVVKALIEAGADVNKADNDGRRRCSEPLRRPRGGGQGADRGWRGRQQGEDDGETPLYKPLAMASRRMVKALIEAGADVNKASKVAASTPIVHCRSGGVTRSLLRR